MIEDSLTETRWTTEDWEWFQSQLHRPEFHGMSSETPELSGTHSTLLTSTLRLRSITDIQRRGFHKARSLNRSRPERGALEARYKK